jgi:peptide/nickel transport system ATP-binding protein
VFHPRCLRKLGPVCETTLPPALPDADAHVLACHIPQQRLRELQLVS